jgi:predicted GTPase
MQEGSTETLKDEVRSTQKFLESLKKSMVDNTVQHRYAQHWVQQIEALQKHKVDTPTIIGVVGNTGAGKSSVVNAMLEEERLVPTNCMRACTAVVTESMYILPAQIPFHTLFLSCEALLPRQQRE